MKFQYILNNKQYLSNAVEYDYEIIHGNIFDLTKRAGLQSFFELSLEIVKIRNHLFGETEMFDTQSNTNIVPVIKTLNHTERPNTPYFGDEDWVSIEIYLDKSVIHSVYTP